MWGNAERYPYKCTSLQLQPLLTRSLFNLQPASSLTLRINLNIETCGATWSPSEDGGTEGQREAARSHGHAIGQPACVGHAPKEGRRIELGEVPVKEQCKREQESQPPADERDTAMALTLGSVVGIPGKTVRGEHYMYRTVPLCCCRSVA